jgi:hypothetical protein
MGAQAAEYAKQYEWEIIAGQLIGVYEEIQTHPFKNNIPHSKS